jgi:hypothetical protein
MTEKGDPSGSLLQQLSRPRLAGSAEVGDVEALLEERLTKLGFSVQTQAFTTNSRRLHAVSIGAAGYGWSAMLAVPLLVMDVPVWSATIVLVALFALVALLAYGLAEGRLPFDLPDISAKNLVATRGPPKIWLVAHSDSKAQGVSMATRIVAVVVSLAGLISILALAVIRMVMPVPWTVAVGCAAVAALGTALLSIKPLESDAPGAVDNATGLMTVLAAASDLTDREDVGVLITGAEELGMEGARRWIATRPEGAYFINIDGIDDRGSFNVMRHSAIGAEQNKSLADALEDALRETGTPVRPKPLPVGVFVDGAILETGGMAGITLSRGDWSTLRVVHTPRDTADRLKGECADRAGGIVAKVVRASLG